jgi:hypothetical protein
MTKYIVIAALCILAPTFLINMFSKGVAFVHDTGSALVKEVGTEAVKSFKESSH